MIYFDNSATTLPYPEAIKTYEEVATKMGVKASELRMLFDISNVASLDKILDFDKETSGIEIIKDDDDTPQEAVLNDEKNANVYDPRKLLGPATKGIASAVTEKMHVFGSINKSN